MSTAKLPAGWAKSTIGEIGEYYNGRGFKKNEWGTSGLPIIRIQNLTGTAEKHNYYNGAIVEKHIVRPGDFLISWAATLGVFLWNGPKAALNQHIFKANSHIDKKFHFFLIENAIQALYHQTHGSGIVHITRGKFNSTAILLPSLNEQRRIVEELEKQLSRLDEAVAGLERAQAKLKRYKGAVLKAAVEGKVTKEWREQNPDIEPAPKLLESILKERRKKWEKTEFSKMRAKRVEPNNNKWKAKYKEPIEALDTPNFELPTTWSWVSIDSIGQIQLGRQRSPKYHSGPNMKPYLRVQNVFEDKIDISDVKVMDFPPPDYETYKLAYGDILLNEGQSPELLGRPAIFRDELPDVCFTNTLIRLRVCEPMGPGFPLLVFRHYMRSGRFLEEGQITTNIAHLSAGRFASIGFPLPPLAEQYEIAPVLEERISIIDSTEKALEKEYKRAERLRQAILQKAFSGQLVPQDPNDEPASELLARIRAVREKSKKREVRKPDDPAGRKRIQNTKKPPAASFANGLSGTAQAILSRMKPGQTYARSELAEPLSLSIGRWNAAIRELKEMGVVLQEGERRGARYRLNRR